MNLWGGSGRVILMGWGRLEKSFVGVKVGGGRTKGGKMSRVERFELRSEFGSQPDFC